MPPEDDDSLDLPMAEPVFDDRQRHTPQLYRYEPLDKERKEIRILSITKSEPIEFEFEYASMKEGQVEDYNAISWCWGDASAPKSKHITIQGRSLPVSETAHDAIMEVCISQKKWRIWIDAVCINQDDLDERNQQVAMMSSIYKKSAMTLVWLGKDTAGKADKAMQMIREIGDWRQVLLGRGPRYGEFWVETTADAFPPTIEWDAVASLFSAAWFTRLWVIQEVVLSKHVHVLLGKKEMCWRFLVQIAHYIVHNTSSTESFVGSSHSGLSSAVMIGKIQDGQSKPLRVLDYSASLGATDPRDRVFALYGLLELDTLDAKSRVALRKAFSPDYSLPLVSIYTKATRAAICASDPALLLRAQCLVQRPGCQHPDTQFPSWVPRYHFVQDKAQGSYKPLSKLAKIPTDSKKQEMRLDTNVPPEILRIAGVVLDTVYEVCAEQLPPSYPNRGHIVSGPCYHVQCAKSRCVEYRERVMRIISQLWHAALAANPHVPSTELATMLRTTLLMRADCDATHLRGFDLDMNHRSAFRDFVAQFWPVGVNNAPTESEVFVQEEPADVDDSDLDNEYSDDEDDFEQPSQLPMRPRVASLEEEHEDSALDKFWDRILLDHVNRKFCVTSSGRMGSAAPQAQTGDRICLLSGMTVPVVLRRVDGGESWVLIGDAYLSGPVNNVRTSRCEHPGNHLAKFGQDQHTDMEDTEERWFNLR
ncbi:hypothetical protein PG997_002652 [Apiospora hydei]|uniref:Heterokaryon incompatibility domain-containing protein n=1 Tax=Apiospora hydei TaxID=1337664 RepID=A0ABR1WX18_9PEZI